MNWLRKLRQVFTKSSHGRTDAEPGPATARSGDQHLSLAASSLQELVTDASIPTEVREKLSEQFRQIEALCQKLEDGDLYLAVFGKVSAGKSSLLNALLDTDQFSVSPLHGHTREISQTEWTAVSDQRVHVFDTPGTEEVAGEERAELARKIARQADLVIFVCDGDLTGSEIDELRLLSQQQRPILVALNKADYYSDEELGLLLSSLKEKSSGMVNPEHIIQCSADPAEVTLVSSDATGRKSESRRKPAPDIEALKSLIWKIIRDEGKTVAAVNAGIFAAQLSEQVTSEIAMLRAQLAQKVLHGYCLAKSIAVAANPIPIADLLAAATIDVSLVAHLSKVYGLPLTRHEAGRLVATIALQLSALMGAVWGVNLLSSALKGVSIGLSTTLTVGAQGMLAYYATYVVGKAAESYLLAGKSWGEKGAKVAVRNILAEIDRDSVLSAAREDILARLAKS